MSAPLVVNEIRKGFYLDSVALMRLSTQLSALPGVDQAALMIGTASNKRVMEEAGLLAEAGRAAGPNDLVIALRAESPDAAGACVAEAKSLLDAPRARAGGDDAWHPKTLDAALEALPGANLALISVPGEFAAEEARRAIRKGLHVMMFSDNVAVADERSLKEEARDRGLLVMGPDCGTAILNGTPLAFANVVPRGVVGLVSASGTGLQEIACLLARGGQGVSHGIGVGGRDLSEAVGGIMTLLAIDALDTDPATEHVVLISKPPSQAVARRVVERVARSPKRFTVCFLGLDALELPPNARLAPTLTAAAEDALGAPLAAGADGSLPKPGAGRRWIRGLFSGGTLCGEAQVVLRAAGEEVASNAPVPGARRAEGAMEGHVFYDLGADEFTVGRPHPMIDPAVRAEPIRRALADPGVAVVLLDVVLGYGSNADPAGAVAQAIAGIPDGGPVVVASVCGTEEDPQVYSAQAEKLREAGVLVAASNARAAETALRIVSGR